MGTGSRFDSVRLYVLVTAELCRGDWLATAGAAIEGGAECVQLREKHLSDRELLRRATALTELAHSRNALCIINDRPDIAGLAGADGVHLGQDDLGVAEVRRVVGERLLVGKSTHSREEVVVAAAEGPDYLAIGSMFASHTKPQVRAVASREVLIVAARSEFAGPIVAIGGIDAENVGQLVLAGVTRVAVCSAVIGVEDPAAAARAIREQLS
jgi:thiamine-phosphate pyrophosphorylase